MWLTVNTFISCTVYEDVCAILVHMCLHEDLFVCVTFPYVDSIIMVDFSSHSWMDQCGTQIMSVHAVCVIVVDLIFLCHELTR